MKFWTTKEEAFLRENHGNMTTDEMAKHLNRSRSSVGVKLSRLNLKLPPQRYEVYKGYVKLAAGTAEECAEKLGVTKIYIQQLACDSHYKRVANYDNPELATTAVKIDY